MTAASESAAAVVRPGSRLPERRDQKRRRSSKRRTTQKEPKTRGKIDPRCSPRAQSHDRDVGMHESVAFEEQRLPRRERECVREAVAEIQVCAMPSLSEAAECAARQFAVFDVGRYEFDACSADEVIQVAHSFGAVLRLEDDGDLDERGDGHQASVSGLDGFDEGTPFGHVSTCRYTAWDKAMVTL